MWDNLPNSPIFGVMGSEDFFRKTGVMPILTER